MDMTFRADRSSKTPIYRQLGNHLIAQILESPQEGEWCLLPEREMCCAYGVSRSTVRQALQYVESQHYINRKRGSGTFVVEQSEATSLMQMYSFTKEMQRQGKVPSSRLISFCRLKEYGAGVRAHLGLTEGQEVYELRRLRLADDEVKMLETTYLSCDRVPELSAERVIANSLYATLQEQYFISLQYAVQEFEVTSASREEAELLGIDSGDPVMLAIRTGYCESGPVEYSKSIIPRGAMRYRVELRV